MAFLGYKGSRGWVSACSREDIAATDAREFPSRPTKNAFDSKLVASFIAKTAGEALSSVSNELMLYPGNTRQNVHALSVGGSGQW